MIHPYIETEANPKFREWLAKQSPDVVAQVTAAWNELETHPDIAQGTKHANYARLAFLMEWCCAVHKYEHG